MEVDCLKKGKDENILGKDETTSDIIKRKCFSDSKQEKRGDISNCLSVDCVAYRVVFEGKKGAGRMRGRARA